MRLGAVMSMALAASGCSEPPCDPAQQACELSHTFANIEVPSGYDDDWWCATWLVDNPEPLWVNAFTQDNAGLLHHANYYFVPEHIYNVPDGLYRCEDLMFSELGATIAGGVLFAQSTQSKHEVQQFPAGVGIQLRERVRIIGNVHLLNLGDEAETTEATITIKTIPPSQAEVRLAPFRYSYEDLVIPASGAAEFTSTCDIDRTHQSIVGGPLDLDLYWVLPHYHQRGSLFRVQIAGGPQDGEEIFRVGAYEGAGDGRGYDPPVSLSGATGLTFTCQFQNPDPVEVRWGPKASDEMCMMLGFARSGMAFDASIDRGKGMLVEQVGGVNRYTGPCSMIGQVWDR